MDRQRLVSLLAGVVFAVGLGVGGMTDPRKVLAFLDVWGHWDPSLAFVMTGAIAVYAPLYRAGTSRRVPLLAPRWYLPARGDIDARLIVGALVFGVGWGLGGFCPGPAVVSVMSGGQGAIVFAIAMVVGMAVVELRPRRADRAPGPGPS
ncbi:MAG: YeeE/YedE family protein [Deltaproteobacteria bacterium]|nr:YeeE/YedE family protein [Deltaproteobacteria bacterium]